MARTVSIAPGEYYHLYNRGTDRRRIFMSDTDRRRFMALLYLCNSTEPVDLKLQGSTLYETSEKIQGDTLIEIIAYCLMPNHFHLIVRERTDGGISKFMQKLTTGYTMYFNIRNERNGSLFQGRFKANHVNTNRYLAYLISYVHLNPIKMFEPKWKETGISDRMGAEKYLRDYRYSSYLDYLGYDRLENKIISKEAMPEYFKTGNEFKSFVTEWLTYSPE